MHKSIVKCAILGGLIVFVWGMVSWMFLPWHKMTILQFRNERQVMDVIQDNAPMDGVYQIPSMQDWGKTKGPMPLIVMNVKWDGTSMPLAASMITGLIIQIVGAFLITGLYQQTKGLNYKKGVAFITVIGLVAGLLGVLPGWNWMGFPFVNALLCIIDLVVGWFLAGLVIAKYAKR